ncbi:MAG: hypothetical protein EXS16_11435 [Gemmataceae bacterium]|nr:hypothetical protein [Gemmataceae bacterium]
MSDEKPKNKKKSMSGKEAYNAVTDTVTGVNVRLSDNLLQAGGALLGLIGGVGIGALVARQFAFEYLYYSCAIGAVVGLITGVFVVGLFLMIFRAIKHARGKHE